MESAYGYVYDYSYDMNMNMFDGIQSHNMDSSYQYYPVYECDENQPLNSQMIMPITTKNQYAVNRINLKNDVIRWQQTFNDILSAVYYNYFDFETFSNEYSKFSKFLCEANARLPGKRPFPNLNLFRIRKKKKCAPATYATSSNPQRTDKSRREREREEYEYELAKHNYFNEWKRTLDVMRDTGEVKSVQCLIPIESLQQHFTEVFSEPNNLTLEYIPSIPAADDIEISIEDVELVIKEMNLDCSPGEDRVLMRSVKDLKVAGVIKTIIDIILLTGTVPKKLKDSRTILLHKGGSPDDIDSWCPISVYSVVRRIIDRVLDRHLRLQIHLISYQRVARNTLPRFNSRLVNQCIDDSLVGCLDCTMVFLDLSTAYQNVGHRHIEACLSSQGVSSNLKRAIMQLLDDNRTIIHTGTRFRSKPISVQRSIPQLSPLSATLFNLAINHIYEDVCESQFANIYGFLYQGDGITLVGYGDDQVVSSNSLEGAIRITELVQSSLQTIGLNLDTRKSSAICIKSGMICPETFELSNNSQIVCAKDDTSFMFPSSYSNFNYEFTFELDSNYFA